MGRFDLERAIGLVEDVLGQEPSQVIALNAGWCLGWGLTLRYQADGNSADLEFSIALFEAIGGAATLGDSRATLVWALGMKFDREQDPSCLDRALALLDQIEKEQRAEVGDGGSSPRDVAASLTRSGLLWQRYRALGERADLDLAIELVGLGDLPSRPYERRTFLTARGLCLTERYLADGGSADLLEVIDHGEEVLRMYGAVRGLGFEDSECNLAQSLLDRFELQGAPSDLRRAVQMLESDVEASDGSSPDGHDRSASRGRAVLARYLADGGPASDLETAVSLLSAVTEPGTELDAETPRRLHVLAEVLVARYRLLHRRDDLAQAETALRRAASCRSAHLLRHREFDELRNRVALLMSTDGS